MTVRRLLLALLLAAGLASPARGQEMQAIGEWFLYQPAAEGQREGLLLMSLGGQERGMLLVFSCPREQLAVALVPREGPPAGPVRLSWRLDADSVHTGDALRGPAPGALVFPLERSRELTRGVAASSWLVMRLMPEDGAERAWAYSLADAHEALGRLSCIQRARQADTAGWERRPRIPITPEVQEIQGEPPPQGGPPREGGPPAEAVRGTPRLLNEQQGLRSMRTGYDPLLRDAGVTGDAVVDLRLDVDGYVRSATVVDVTHDLFRVAAENAAYRLRFDPASAAGAQVRVLMKFDPRPGKGSIQIVDSARLTR